MGDIKESEGTSTAFKPLAPPMRLVREVGTPSGLGGILVTLGIVIMSLHFSIVYATKHASVDEITRLSAENERLRIFNTRMVRRLKWINRPEKIDPEVVAMPEHLLGIPVSIAAALLFCENGPGDIESGSIDKTDFWAKNMPIKFWTGLDGSRTLNRELWAWIQDHPVQFKQFLYDAALPYTNMNKPLQMQWAANMFQANERFKKDISIDHSPIVVVAHITPTPNYGAYSDSQAGKAKAPAKKVHRIRRDKK